VTLPRCEDELEMLWHISALSLNLASHLVAVPKPISFVRCVTGKKTKQTFSSGDVACRKILSHLGPQNKLLKDSCPNL
jgi:hypothetical protein